ncbi:sensor histidine kinase [Larkinella insperata]|uniref:Sensor histidine kinase n=1 Tax=Larkinella insperata TaxID=332158 RepID=A0ABW3Q2J2_9BACT|nr:histidine kinase [Larkinella insperata]
MIQKVYRRSTAFFSRWELWYHILMMPILFPVGNYFFLGPNYFQDGRVFLLGTAVIFFLYWLSVITLTLAVRWVLRRFPGVERATRRTLVMLVLVGGLTVGLAVLDLFTYSLFPSLGVTLDWQTVRPILVLGLVFDLCFCVALNVFYTYRQWHLDQTENEQLRQATLQHQLDTLKLKINPHFLFNSLTSLSSLIGEDQQRAEQFVDQLSKVYRYLLQSNTRELVSLQTELEFMANYVDLLQTRYGSGLRIDHSTDATLLDHLLPPLSLQTLIDNAIKHNIMSASRPLFITIQTTQDRRLLIRNNLQRKTVKMDLSQAKLTNLLAKFRQLTPEEVRVQETDTHFEVSLPLLVSQPARP